MENQVIVGAGRLHMNGPLFSYIMATPAATWRPHPIDTSPDLPADPAPLCWGSSVGRTTPLHPSVHQGKMLHSTTKKCSLHTPPSSVPTLHYFCMLGSACKYIFCIYILYIYIFYVFILVFHELLCTQQGCVLERLVPEILLYVIRPYTGEARLPFPAL